MKVTVNSDEVILYASPRELDALGYAYSEVYSSPLRISFSLKEREMHLEAYDRSVDRYTCVPVNQDDCPTLAEFIKLVTKARGPRVEALKAMALTLAEKEEGQ